MNLEKRIVAFAKLGEILRKKPEDNLLQAIHKAEKHNGWFTEENILLAINSIGEMLAEDKIRKWISSYSINHQPSTINHRIGVIMAGNIPLVGFHDFLCVLMSGNSCVGKLSSEDRFLLPAVSEIVIGIEPEFKNNILFVSSDSPLPAGRHGFRERTSAFIATGSNNSARYFEYYFSNFPHIIRKNRNAVAILDGKETKEDLQNLGEDIFQYFGLGCRNVSKVFIPQNYDLDKFFSAIIDFSDVIHHNKYYNNYTYYRSIYLLNKEKFFDNNFLLLKEDKRIASPVANLFYERYESKEELLKRLEKEKSTIQCIVAGRDFKSRPTVAFGQSQSPELWDYADGINTMEFLLNLHV
ncbi:MAG: acyl-CoA reductase [Bacteroidetes bacterium]|nr:acyl-CoA reductase [Bacteroidota bacterium]